MSKINYRASNEEIIKAWFEYKNQTETDVTRSIALSAFVAGYNACKANMGCPTNNVIPINNSKKYTPGVVTPAERQAQVLPIEDVRDFVINCIHWNGSFRNYLSKYNWEFAYLMADGFGRIGKCEAIENDWDWSHVRDSSEGALRRMYAYLYDFVY